MPAGKSEESIAETEISDISTLDVKPPAGTPIKKLFRMCLPTKSDLEEDDEDSPVAGSKPFEIKGRSLDFETEVQVEDSDDAEEGPVLFDTGLLCQMGVIGAVLVYETLA